MFNNVYPKYRNKPVVPTKDAANELIKADLDLDDVVEILNHGFDCAAGKRKENVLERGLQRKGSLSKVVVVEKKDRFLLIHVGKLTFSKKLRRKLKNVE